MCFTLNKVNTFKNVGVFSILKETFYWLSNNYVKICQIVESRIRLCKYVLNCLPFIFFMCQNVDRGILLNLTYCQPPNMFTFVKLATVKYVSMCQMGDREICLNVSNGRPWNMFKCVKLATVEYV